MASTIEERLKEKLAALREKQSKVLATAYLFYRRYSRYNPGTALFFAAVGLL